MEIVNNAEPNISSQHWKTGDLVYSQNEMFIIANDRGMFGLISLLNGVTWNGMKYRSPKDAVDSLYNYQAKYDEPIPVKVKAKAVIESYED